MIEEIAGVLEFWFGKGKRATEVAAEKSALWWSKDDRVDQEIAARFAATAEAASQGQLDQWSESPRGLLALIICTDQFPRNIYRDTPKAFAWDPVAQRFAAQCVPISQQLRPIERTFAYLPFEHSEKLADQQQSIALYHALAQSVPQSEAALFNQYLEFARKHHEIIARFHRFPHRNEILGRPSTAEEDAFLKQPGSSF